MGPNVTRAGAANDLLAEFVAGGRGRALRAQLAARYPERHAEDIEEAVQAAAADFLAEGEGITDPGVAYAWLRTAAHRILGHEADRRRREVAVDPMAGGLERPVPAEHDPAAELVAGEDEADLADVVRELAASFPPRRRAVFALWAAGRKRPQIAAELGVRERMVKRDLLEIMEEGRNALARRSGGGCEQGESLVTRFVCGLAGSVEAAQARLHLERCGRCSSFAARMTDWREKAGVLLALPALEAAGPGPIGRTIGRIGEGVASARRHLLGGGPRMRQQAAVAGYARGTDPTPLAGIRPGAVAAVIAGCLAVGGGATHCAQNGVGPLGPVADLLGGQESAQHEPPKPPESEEPAAEVTPTPVEYEPSPEPTYEPAPRQESRPEQKSEPAPAAEPEPEPVVEEEAPVESSFEPTSPDYPTESEPEDAAAPTVSAEPKPVPANEAPQFGGP